MATKKRKTKHTLNPVIILFIITTGLVLVLASLALNNASLSTALKSQVSSGTPIACTPPDVKGIVVPSPATAFSETNQFVGVTGANKDQPTRIGASYIKRYAEQEYDKARIEAIERLYTIKAPETALATFKCADLDCELDLSIAASCVKPSLDKITLDITKEAYLAEINRIITSNTIGENSKYLTWLELDSTGRQRKIRISAYVTAKANVTCTAWCKGKYPAQSSAPVLTQCEPDVCSPPATAIQTITRGSLPTEGTNKDTLIKTLEAEAKAELDKTIGAGCTTWLNYYTDKFPDPPAGCGFSGGATGERIDHSTCDNNVVLKDGKYFGSVWCSATCKAEKPCVKKTTSTSSPDPIFNITDSPNPSPAR